MKCHCNADVKVDPITKKPVKFEKTGLVKSTIEVDFYVNFYCIECMNTSWSCVYCRIIDTGHILGKADTRSKEPENVRNLMPLSCSMVRVLLHSILTWSSCFPEVCILVISHNL